MSHDSDKTGDNQRGRWQQGSRKHRYGRQISGGNGLGDAEAESQEERGPSRSRRSKSTKGDLGFSKPEPGSPEAARQYCLRLLSARPRTYAELTKALEKREFEAEVIAEVLDRYAEVGMIDDEVFARAWVTSRHRSRGLARRALAGELRRKGVESDHIDQALQEVSDDDERSAALDLARRRVRSLHGKPHEVIVRRLVGQLARRGYPAGLAFSVVKEVLEEQEETAAASELIDTDVEVGVDDGVAGPLGSAADRTTVEGDPALNQEASDGDDSQDSDAVLLRRSAPPQLRIATLRWGRSSSRADLWPSEDRRPILTRCASASAKSDVPSAVRSR
ncbi:regulatory protein RecX [Natronoglycomyces albus]|uniref:Regulatory protein RecX n=1 Tax=Natronoglycomyces albus TaxID=2811108 RepID=A0A895XVP2_9ACTN|nr:regulatory protein RecX [Natronoglycomyces albus]QSB06596.1 regulatory protein RecX [Natronoglycomyces albus]